MFMSLANNLGQAVEVFGMDEDEARDVFNFSKDEWNGMIQSVSTSPDGIHRMLVEKLRKSQYAEHGITQAFRNSLDARERDRDRAFVLGSR